MRRFAALALLLAAGVCQAGPSAAHAYFLKAREQERRGDAAGALELYKQAFQHDSRNRDLCFLYLDHLKGAGSIDSAYALGSRCASLKGDPTLSEYKMLGEIALRAEEETAALMFYREAFKLDDDDGDVLYILAGLYEEAQDWEGYVEVVGALLPRLGYPAPLMERQLRAFSRLDRPEAALALLKDAWRETGRVAYGQSLAAYYDGRGMNVSLLEVARTLAATQPDPEHEWLLARAYAATDRADSALWICERLMDSEKRASEKGAAEEDQSVRYFYTYLLFDRGRYAEAYASARTLVKARPEAASNYFLQGSAAVELRRSDARALLEKAVARAPWAPDYRARLAYAEYVFNKPSKAAAQASARLAYAVTDSLKAGPALLLEGFAQGQLARMLDPREAWERPAVFSDTAAARRHRLQAVARFEKVLAGDSLDRGGPGRRAAAFELATHLDRLGQRARAKDLLRGLVREDTTHAMALNYLGYMLVENLPVDSADIEEAGALLDRALALEPENGAYLDSKGWWFYRAGSLDSARIYLERASLSISSDPAIRDHLKEVLQARKRAGGP